MKGRVIPPRIYFHHMHDELVPIKESRFTSASLTTELVGGGEEEEVWGGRAIQRLRNCYERARPASIESFNRVTAGTTSFTRECLDPS